MSKKKPERDSGLRNRPLHIPLNFDRAVEGLLAVDPKEPEDGGGEKTPKRRAKKKPRDTK